MNPLNRPLNQLNYLLWSVVLTIINFATLIAILKTRDQVPVNNWLLGALAAMAAVEITAFVIISANRLRDAGYNRWFSLLVLAPYVGFPFVWLVLVILPSHKKYLERPVDVFAAEGLKDGICPAKAGLGRIQTLNRRLFR
jgi:hypothetical protein